MPVNRQLSRWRLIARWKIWSGWDGVGTAAVTLVGPIAYFTRVYWVMPRRPTLDTNLSGLLAE